MDTLWRTLLFEAPLARYRECPESRSALDVAPLYYHRPHLHTQR